MAQSWYPFYVGDYARKTAHLSMLEHGAYRLLLDHYYATGEPLPDDNVKLFRICRARTPSERQSVLSTVAEFFTKDGTLLRSEKCDRVLDKQLNYSNSQSAKAKLRHSNGNATAMPRARVTKTITKTKVSKDTIEDVVLPDWLPKESWEEFKQHRRNKKDPLTPLAESKALKLLMGFVSQGHDPIELIDKAIASGWKTFYISNNFNKQTGGNNVTNNRAIDPASNAHAKAQSIIARRTAAWQNAGGEESTYNAT